MLYVSSIKDGRYYITDTSDGIEEVVDKSQLLEIVRLGLKCIRGIHLQWKNIGKCL